MSITRTAWTDDDGSGTTGTILQNSEKTSLYDQIDGRWSEATITSTGSQNNLTYSEADVIRCNNASDLTLTGITAPASPAKPGKRLIIVSVGAGHVFLTHQSGSSTAANRLINIATSGLTPLAAGKGVALYVYDDTTDRWRLVAHDQGGPITPTFADSHYLGVSTDADWALASGDRVTQEYTLVGKRVFVSWFLNTTTVANTPASLNIANTAWGGFTSTKQKLRPCVYNDNAGGNAIGFAQVTAGGTSIGITKLSGNFANSTNQTYTFGDIDFEVD